MTLTVDLVAQSFYGLRPHMEGFLIVEHSSVVIKWPPVAAILDVPLYRTALLGVYLWTYKGEYVGMD